MSQIKLLIADDHTLMRQGLREICEGMGGFTVIAEANNGAQAVELARKTEPDVILMDIIMLNMDGVEAISQIMRDNPTARIIALSMYHEKRYMNEAIRAGARGYLLKTVDARDLIAAIEAVNRGDYLVDPVITVREPSEFYQPAQIETPVKALTECEIAILRLVAQGVDNKNIARMLNYSVYTVANRLRIIYVKLHVTNRTQATLFAMHHGLVALDQPAV